MKGLDVFVRFLLLPVCLIFFKSFVPTVIEDIKDYALILSKEKRPLKEKKTISIAAATAYKNSFSRLPNYHQKYSSIYVNSYQDKRSKASKVLEG